MLDLFDIYIMWSAFNCQHVLHDCLDNILFLLVIRTIAVTITKTVKGVLPDGFSQFTLVLLCFQ